jgi:molybdenum cofactor cytidylyltransferase
MTRLLSDRLGLGSRELVSIVGAGGKTTILTLLGRDLASTGASVILTTTTRMAGDQITEPVSWSDDPVHIQGRLNPGTALFVLGGAIPGKVVGLLPEFVEQLFVSTSADYIIVEADGAGPWLIKVPAVHEPVIPNASTTVIVVAGADALGRPIAQVAHRIELVRALTGLVGDDLLTPERAAMLLLHRNGGLREIPESARIVMAISNVTPTNEAATAELAEILRRHPRVERCIAVERVPPGEGTAIS